MTKSVLIALSSDGDYLWDKRFESAVLTSIALQQGASNVYLCGAVGSEQRFAPNGYEGYYYYGGGPIYATIPGVPGPA